MKAVIFRGERKLELVDRPDPEPGLGEVVLDIRASGMCGTDLHEYRGPRQENPFIPGHEPCGVVRTVGEGVSEKEAKVGDRVMVHHYDGCRTCNHCREGWTQMCTSYSTVYGGGGADGAHARLMKVPAHALIRLPEALSFKAGAAISCGTGTAYGALKRLDLAGDETLVVFGQGPVGLSATLLAKAMGARVIALDVMEDRRKLAAQFDADHVIDPATENVAKVVKSLTSGLGAHKSMDCSSNPEARALSLKVLRKWGTACLVGVRGDIQFGVDTMILKQLSLIGSWTFSKSGQAECAGFVCERNLDIDALFSHEFSLDDAAEAYRLFDGQGMGKGVFLM